MNSSAGEAESEIVPSMSTIREAQGFLAEYLARTRLIPAPFLTQATSKNVYLKLEAELPRHRSKCEERSGPWHKG
jgi:threonine dehydratase